MEIPMKTYDCKKPDDKPLPLWLLAFPRQSGEPKEPSCRPEGKDPFFPPFVRVKK